MENKQNNSSNTNSKLNSICFMHHVCTDSNEKYETSNRRLQADKNSVFNYNGKILRTAVWVCMDKDWK